MQKIGMLGSGFIAEFYISAIQGQRSKDKVIAIASRTMSAVDKIADKYDISFRSTEMLDVINHPEVDLVCIGLPNYLHKAAVLACAKAGKGVICTKPLGRNAEEALEMLEAVEEAGVFHGYMEDLVYTPKTLRTMDSIKQGAIGKVLWARSRETHPGPHSDWFWDKNKAGGGAILDLACHCIEIARCFIGKEHKPIEVMCWADTQVKPIEAEDHAIGLVKYSNGAIGQFEVSWAFRGGLDLRDEVMGTHGTVWLNHFLRTGFDMFTAPGQGGYVAEKAESDSGWIFPVGDENQDLGYNHMFADMFNAKENGSLPAETFYDGYIVNAVMDAAYASVKSKKWEPVLLPGWKGPEPEIKSSPVLEDYDDQYYLIKEELLPDGSKKIILKDKNTGEIIQK
ncbi:MAG: Gfo/Idh/MocA family oxidoreductase [Saprospiraceae bacterium]|nr:Gfo/Idh/MocA family oxidoreductase [Saprospiraceae bacterium]